MKLHTKRKESHIESKLSQRGKGEGFRGVQLTDTHYYT